MQLLHRDDLLLCFRLCMLPVFSWGGSFVRFQCSYLSITLAMKGSCISILCSSSSVSILIVSKLPLAYNSSFTEIKGSLSYDLAVLQWITLCNQKCYDQMCINTFCGNCKVMMTSVTTMLLILQSNYAHFGDEKSSFEGHMIKPISYEI